MHTIEPFYNWRHLYTAEEDERTPYFEKEYSEFVFHNTIYNYYIHPQWDEFGSPTLYIKLLYLDYNMGFAVIELMGEWNDGVHNDIMFLKQEIANNMIQDGINKFILIGENVLNFHGSDDCYYEEWREDVEEEGGWICLLNFREHVMEEMQSYGIHHQCFLGPQMHYHDWRTYEPIDFFQLLERKLFLVLS